MTRLRRRLLCSLFLAVLLTAVGQAQTDVVYIYDDLGRLIGVVDPSGETVTYTYDAAGNLLSISRFSSSQLSIIDFTPKKGPEGTTVTIYGTGFSLVASENTVKFNGVTGTVTSATATRIVTSVPQGATTGPVSVTTPANTATSSVSFDVTADAGAPTINSISPLVGHEGTAVTIAGTNFDTTAANNKVKFNIAKAMVETSTTTSLSTSVPPRATSGRITLSTPGGTTVSTQDFFVPPSPYTAADVEYTARMVIGSSNTVTISTANKIGLLIFDGVVGQQVSMHISSVSMTSGDAYIYAPDGTQIGTLVGFYSNFGFMEPIELPVNGTYTILIDPRSTYTGSATVNLYDVPPDDFTVLQVTGAQGSGSVVVGTPGQNAYLTFNAIAGARVSWQIGNVSIPNTSTGVTIYNPDGSVLVPRTTVGPSGTFIDSKALATTGTYRMDINPWAHYTGGATVTAYDATDVTGTITPGGPSVTPSTTSPGQDIRLTFNGTANQRVSLKIENITIPQSSTVSILKPDGTTLASTGVSSPYVWFIDVQTLPVAGTYTVLVNPSGANTGGITLTLYDVPPDVTGTIAIGGSATVNVMAPGQKAELTFTGTTGQKVSLQMSNVSITDSYIYIYKPDGSTFKTERVGLSGKFVDTMTLPTDGTYRISIDPLYWYTGSITFTLYDAADLTGTITPGGPPETVSITTPGQNAFLTFEGTLDQRISLKAENITIPSTTLVSILKPDGTTLVSLGGIGGPGTFFTDTKTLPTTGTYMIKVDPYSSNTGSLTLTLYDVPADFSGTITVGGPAVGVTISVPGQNGELTFEGTADQQVTPHITNNTIAGVWIKILRPEGTVLNSTYTSGQTVYYSPLTLPVTGTYKILIDPNSYQTGSMDIVLNNP